MSFTPANDDLIKEIVLLKKKPIYLHGYFAPFLLAYAFAGFLWKQYFGIEQYEIGIIIGISIAFLQLLAVLFCLWSVDVRSALLYSKVKDVEIASFAKVTPTSHNGSVELLQLQKRPISKDSVKTWIDFQKVTYVYDYEEKKCFLPIKFPIEESFYHYQTWKGFLTEPEFQASKELYGNNVMEMAIPEFKELFIERASAPFFVFQVFCVGLWCLDEYWYYSLFTLFMLVAFEASLVYQQLRNMAEIRKMGNKPYSIYVYRCKKWRHVESNQLVAGDIVSLTRSPSSAGSERSIPCDMLLLRGRLIVDEAMLTGESIPQMKDPIESMHGDTILDLPVHSRVHIINGGTRIVQHDAPARKISGETGVSKPPDNGCIGYVLRTGFNTSQGKLLRTILFGVKRVTANNLETFAFIMFLLIFAIAASAYVWVIGSADPKRSRYKLVLNCVLILTSVVPPELPIELSLAVNSSLLALSKLYVYCTEPFRIPFAGKVDICCLDKTGTLTSDCLVVEGIAGIKKQQDKSDSLDEIAENSELCPVRNAPAETQTALATCHSLVKMDRDLVGDPLEQAMLKAVEWDLSKADAVIPRRRGPGVQGSKIVQRFHFSSALKRMSCIISQEEFGQRLLNYFVTVKGAAEVLKDMFTSIPDDYDDVHQNLSRRGARVLALGFRSLGTLTPEKIRDMKREYVEKDLNFAGFVIVSSPLKRDSKSIMREIRHSSHYVTMITGDNPLTACHVGKVLRFCVKDVCLILTEKDSSWKWVSVDGQTEVEVDFSNWKKLATAGYDLCMTGDGLAYLEAQNVKYLNKLLPSVRIFARVSPKQKEQVITSLKQIGFVVLMCGDGTNDVGALKHAHVGVALLSNAPESIEKKEKTKKEENKDIGNDVSPSDSRHDLPRGSRQRRPIPRSSAEKRPPNAAPKSRLQLQQEELARRRQKLQDMVGELEPDPQIVKMGDASIAAPFSYKLSSILAICHIIKQGRCTLVTTLQMFKILALNALILAYSQSVLFLDGVKFSDGQATLQGLLLAGCFLFISRSKPLKTLSKERPLPNIFNVYTILTITLQFAVHFTALVFLVREAKLRDPREVDFEADFEANLLNSTVYVLSLATQIMTFAINYRGHPFMESLLENKPLLYSLLASSFFLLSLTTGITPELNEYFEIVIFESEFRFVILQVLGGILVSTWLIDRSLRFLLGAGRLRKLT